MKKILALTVLAGALTFSIGCDAPKTTSGTFKATVTTPAVTTAVPATATATTPVPAK